MRGLLRLNLALGALGSVCLTLLCLVLLVPEVTADSSGDAPPPTGDWNINNATALWDETRVIDGSINVNDGSLTLDNVTLYVRGHLRVDAPTEIYRSTIIVTRARGFGGVDIRDPMTLDNVTLRLNLTANPTQANEQQKIVVTSTGTLLVHNNSLISDGDNIEDDDTIAPGAQSNNYRMRFIVENGGRFEVYDSTISEVGWANPSGGGSPDQTRGGIAVEAINVTLSNATISKCWYGIYLRTGAANARIDNSTFIDLEVHGIVTYATDGLVENTTFQDLNIAHMAYYQSVRWTFQYNTITSCTHGLQLNFADTYIIRDNQFSSINQRVLDLRGDAVQNTFIDNTITTAGYGLWSEGVRQSWGDRTYRWNPHHIYYTDNRLTGVTTGLHFDAGSTGDRERSGGHNVSFTDNTFDGGTTGIVVSQGGNRRLIDDFTISGNRLVNVTDVGFQFTQLYDSLITDNRIIGGSMGVKLIRSSGLRMNHNLLFASNFTGFHLTESTQDNELDNNTIEGSLGQGFYMKNSGPNSVHHNRVANFTGAGLWTEEQVTGTFVDNTLEHGGEGFHLVGTAPTIRDNDLVDLQWGYYLLDVTLASLQDELSGITKGRLWQEHSLTVTVEDEENNTKRNIEVEVYDVHGTLVATDSSDSEGLTRSFNLTHYRLDPEGVRTDLTPHRAWAYRGTGSISEAYSASTPNGQLTLRIDLISPASWVMSQGDWVNTSQVMVTWQVLGGHTDVVLFHIDQRYMEPGQAYTNWTPIGSFATTSTLFNVTEGNIYQIRSRAEDDFGNLEEGSSEWEFEVDMTPPDSVLTSPDVADGEKTALGTVLLEWEPTPMAAQVDTYTLLHRWRILPSGTFGQWSVYAGLEDTRVKSYDFEGPGGFEYQLKVLAVDDAGNREVKSEPDLTFSLDHEAPEAWLLPLPTLQDSDRLALTVDFPLDSDLEFVTIRYLKYLEVRYDEGDAPSGTWLNLGVYDRETLQQGSIVIDQLATNSYYLFRLAAQDDVGNEDERIAIEEFYTGNATADQTLQLKKAVEPAGSKYTNDHVRVQALQGEEYGPALRQSTKLPLENPDMYFLDEHTGLITFGDGQNGFQPAAGQSIRVTYDGYDDLTLVDLSAPAAPYELNSEILTNTSIRLTWHIPDSPDVVGYQVEYQPDQPEVQWENLTTVDHAPTGGYISVTLENLSREVIHFRILSIDRVNLASSPSGEVKVDLSIPEEPAIEGDDDEEGPPVMLILVILVVVMVICGAGFYILTGRGRGADKGPVRTGDETAPPLDPEGKAPSRGPTLEPVAPGTVGAGGVVEGAVEGAGADGPGPAPEGSPAVDREPDEHAQFSRPTRPTEAPDEVPPSVAPFAPVPPITPVTPQTPVAPLAPMAPVEAPSAGSPAEPAPSEAAEGDQAPPPAKADFQVLDGELICLSCGTAQGLMVGGGVDVTCHACGIIGTTPP